MFQVIASKGVCLLLIGLMLCFLPARACLNPFYVNQKGEIIDPMESGSTIIRLFSSVPVFNYVKIARDLKKKEEQLKIAYDFKLHADYAIDLLKYGQTQDGLKILQQLSRQYPDSFQIAGNLGTAYELAGEIDSALKYIQKEIALNPNAHDKSEWIHVKILEAKRRQAANPYPSSVNLLDWSTNPQETAEMLQIQLIERLPFTPQPDEIVAQLLTELGDNLMDYSMEHVYMSYLLAEAYAPTKGLLKSKIDDIEKKVERWKKENADKKYDIDELPFAKMPSIEGYKARYVAAKKERSLLPSHPVVDLFPSTITSSTPPTNPPPQNTQAKEATTSPTWNYGIVAGLLLLLLLGMWAYRRAKG